MKRIFDCVATLVLLLILAPLLCIVIVAVEMDSAGPAFYRQKRIGRYGRPFRLWKFRTMSVEKAAGPILTQKGDRRITRVGQLLRRYRLDEIPQLLNVLAGDMSLVGPRPELPELVAEYTEEERRVLEVRPGITGLTQLQWHDEDERVPPGADVVRFYIDHFMHAKLRSDLVYVAGHTFWGDILILLRTIAWVSSPSPTGRVAHVPGRRK